ncbi:MAG: hypothetical protein FXF47_04620 [Candidatus Mcinerneyibacterium aminivorans]|uniref:Uncharacterized protein n=1 Tax=Candidatus Mcinerneyibacterium aminivorans TaxID=2703815 RepID=A0A5D0MC23_9BACT|nr:MAG: hypothetical protein FXF47_04620 [Candidatus Mcinerneyibacterium aminivorans]
MGTQRSFSKLERKYSPELREKVSSAEDVSDLMRNFSSIVTSFLDRALEDYEEIEIDGYSVNFEPGNEKNFKIDKRLKTNETFKEIWENSDLRNVLKRFADSAYKRYVHLEKHNEKTNKKIRN